MNSNKQFPPLVYVAGPYNSSTTDGILENIYEAEKVSIELIRNGWHVITPHKNTSGYEQYEVDGISKQTWIDMDLGILCRCDAIYVMNNWSRSHGTIDEIIFAMRHGIPIFYEDYILPKHFTVEAYGILLCGRYHRGIMEGSYE